MLRFPYLCGVFICCVVAFASLIVINTTSGLAIFLSAFCMGMCFLVFAIWIKKDIIRKAIVFVHSFLGITLLAWIIASIFSRNVIFENCKSGFKHNPAILLVFATVFLAMIYFPFWFFTRHEVKDFYKRTN